MRRTVDRQAATADPNLIWNAFVDLVAMEEYASLSDVQRQGHLVFWYESEVQNGGHLQFFVNRGTDLLEETLASLDATGLRCQVAVLRRAADGWLMAERQAPESVEEYVEVALEAEFRSSTKRSIGAAPASRKHSNATWSVIATSTWFSRSGSRLTCA